MRNILLILVCSIVGLLIPLAGSRAEDSVGSAEAMELPLEGGFAPAHKAKPKALKTELAQPVSNRNPEFIVPEKLRPRVNFWIDIFAVYGKAQVVIHHRDFPQAVFSVVDLTDELNNLGNIQFERAKKEKVDREIKRVSDTLLALGRGEHLADALAQNIEHAMKLVPGGAQKFTSAVKDDLVRSQTGIRERWAQAVSRASRYMHFIEQIFKDAGLPVEVAKLPFIESSFDYQAYSSVGAAGIWQFMRGTARKMMMVNSLIDERRDVLSASRAASRYLSHAYETLGSWPLAITSYNHGIAGVLRKVRDYGSSDLASIIEDPNQRVFGFASTNFYPEFLAALEVYEKRRQYFPEVRDEAPLHLSEITLSHSATLGFVLKEFPGISLDELRDANLGVSDAIWRGRSRFPPGYTLKVPARFAPNANHFKNSPPEPDVQPASSVYGGIVYKVRKGDTIYSIAKRYQTSAAKIVELNELSGNALKVGQILTVKNVVTPTVSQPKSLAKVIEPKTKEKRTENMRRSYKVQKGDTLWTIARKFGKGVDSIKASNRLSKGIIKPGQTLTIP